MENFRDEFGREWFFVTSVPLAINLQTAINYLQQQKVILRVTEEAEAQQIWCGSSFYREKLRDYFDALQRGDVDQTFLDNATTSAPLPRKPDFTRLLFALPGTFTLLLGCIIGLAVVKVAGQLPLYSWLTFQDAVPIRLDLLNQTFPWTQPWRFITPMFLHYDIFHLGGNALFVWVLGARIEKYFGLFKFLIFVLVVGVLANVAQFAWVPNPNFGGMSGVNYGFVGFLLLRHVLAPHPLLHVPVALLIFSVVMMVISMLGITDLFIPGGIANAAHLTGFMAGATIGLVSALNDSHVNKLKENHERR